MGPFTCSALRPGPSRDDRGMVQKGDAIRNEGADTSSEERAELAGKVSAALKVSTPARFMRPAGLQQTCSPRSEGCERGDSNPHALSGTGS